MFPELKNELNKAPEGNLLCFLLSFLRLLNLQHLVLKHSPPYAVLPPLHYIYACIPGHYEALEKLQNEAKKRIHPFIKLQIIIG